MVAQIFHVEDAAMRKWGQLVKSLATGIDHFHGLTAADLDPATSTKLVSNLVPGAVALFANPNALARLQGAVAKVKAGADTGGPINVRFQPAEFESLLKSLSIAAELPDGTTEVRLVQSGNGCVFIRLPARQALLEQEFRILSGTAAYAPPQFVTDWFARRAAAGTPPSVDEQMELNDNFVGDYAVTHCM